MSQMIIVSQTCCKNLKIAIIKQETNFNINFQKTIKTKMIIAIIKKHKFIHLNLIKSKIMIIIKIKVKMTIIKTILNQNKRFKDGRTNKLKKDKNW